MFSVMTFYAFAAWPTFADHRFSLTELCQEHDLTGSILLAPEGVNGTVSGEDNGLATLLAELRSIDHFSELTPKYSTSQHQPFRKMKVRLKKEIVTLGIGDIDVSNTGTYIPAAEWDELISDPDVILIDTRNEYEIEIGSFPGAINPHTDAFGDFPEWVENNLDPSAKPKVAMFCTGGIRCEKASAYLRGQGFDEVYQLQGGILKYLEDIPPEETNWLGDCYVFDERVSVKPGLIPGDYEVCVNCNAALGEAELGDDRFEKGVACPRCSDTITPDRRARFAERQRQIELAEARGLRHMGPQA